MRVKIETNLTILEDQLYNRLVRRVIYSFLIYRFLIFIPVLLAQSFLTFRKGFEYTSFTGYNPLLSVWANFDGIYYLAISTGGYSAGMAGFFPAYPFLIKSLSIGDPSTLLQLLIAVAFSTVIFLLTGVVLFKLVKLDYEKNIAFWSVFFLLIFPTSFFGVSVYSESLFLLLALSSFYFARRKKWFIASILAGLLTATRLVGIAIIPALFFEFFVQEKKLFKKNAISLFIAPLGILSYMFFNFQHFGNVFQFVKSQGTLHNNRSVDSVILFPQTIYRYLKILTTGNPGQYEWWIGFLEISMFIFALTMIFIAWKEKIRSSYLIYSIVALLIPASTGTFSGIPRYILILFPIFIILALIKNKWVKIIYSTISIILLFMLLMLFSRGYYIS